jgi:hypothetical protein
LIEVYDRHRPDARKRGEDRRVGVLGHRQRDRLVVAGQLLVEQPQQLGEDQREWALPATVPDAPANRCVGSRSTSTAG